MTGVVGTAAPFLTARRARLGSLDEKVHEKRLELYPGLVGACHQLALFFPDYTLPAVNTPAGALTPAHCAAMGRKLSKWYFEDGGLLISKEARDCYFALARALTGAANAPALAVPTFPDDAKKISDLEIDGYRKQLKLLVEDPSAKKQKVKGVDLQYVDRWTVGPGPLPALSGRQDAGASPSPEQAARFKDYVLLQMLSSRLRSTLAEDLRSRRRPQ